jgi:hypothetical protein
MEINFIISCFNREDYWPYLLKIINGYTKIKANIILAYNGDSDQFKQNSSIVLPNYGHQKGEATLILAGFKYAKENFPNCKKFIKLGMDSWLLDENVITDIFDRTDRHKSCYAGNFWSYEHIEIRHHLSTDVFFVNEDYGDFYENYSRQKGLIETLPFNGLIMEDIMYNCIVNIGSPITIIEEREPVHPNNRMECKKLNWIMSHDLNENIHFMNNYYSNK